jgi:hypothetical protein
MDHGFPGAGSRKDGVTTLARNILNGFLTVPGHVAAMPDIKLPDLIPVKDVCKYGGPKPTTVYKLLNEGKLTAIKTTWGTRITGESLAKLLASQPQYLSALLRDLADVL